MKSNQKGYKIKFDGKIFTIKIPTGTSSEDAKRMTKHLMDQLRRMLDETL